MKKQIYFFKISEAISSDEDDVDEFNSYLNLDSIKNFATKKAAQEGVDMSAEIKVNKSKCIYLFALKN